MRGLGAASIGAYDVIRELGARSQPTLAAVRTLGSRSDTVVVTRFVRSNLRGATGPGVVDAAAFATLAREARAAERTFHPNLVRVRHVDVAHDELSIATDMIEGATLADLEGAAVVPIGVHLRILLDVLMGLGALHAMRDGGPQPLGLVHGELCPENVVVGKDGVARLVALFRPRPVRIGDRSEGIAYASPEALDADGTSDPRSDLWSAGVMLWEVVAGHRLFARERDRARLLSLLRSREIPRPYGEDAPSLLKRLSQIALRAMTFDATLRWRSAAEMAAELRTAAGRAVAPGSAVAQHVTEVAGETIRARRAALEGAPGETRRTTSSGVRRSVQLDHGAKVTLAPHVVEEDAFALDAGVRIADSSLMPPAAIDVACAQGIHDRVTLVDADATSDDLEDDD